MPEDGPRYNRQGRERERTNRVSSRAIAVVAGKEMACSGIYRKGSCFQDKKRTSWRLQRGNKETQAVSALHLERGESMGRERV